MAHSANLLSAKLLDEIANLKDEAIRARYLSRHRIQDAAVVQQLNDASREKLRVDPRQALALAEMAVAIANKLAVPDKRPGKLSSHREILARAFRAKANALYTIGDNAQALDYHGCALDIFRKTLNAEEQARTLNSSIQPNILLGRYDQALEAAEGARVIFDSTGDTRRLGHVEINVGNIFHRQDRFEDALACYEHAYEMLAPLRDAEGLAVTLSNVAVCLITLNDFPRALATYQRAREMFVRYGMTLLVTQSDYNIAYLYYLRGEYGRAIQMLRSTRVESKKNGDAHVHALCFLDLSEIYLELNMSEEARQIAQEGCELFQELGMEYEVAKCLANEAMASSQLGKAIVALDLFGKAREILSREDNLVWPSLIDLYQAVVLFGEDRLFEARRLCSRSAEFFETSVLHGKAALCHLLLARIAMRTGELESARGECAHAIERVAGVESPSLRYQAYFLMGQIQQASGETDAAYASYQAARSELETLRGSLRGEELKIAFMKNRLEVYECLVELCLQSTEVARSGARPAISAGVLLAGSEPAIPRSYEQEAFAYIELAKSRSLAELLLHPGASLASREEGQSGLVRRIRAMREELNWYYRRIEREQLSVAKSSCSRIEDLQREAIARENDLVRILRELRSSETVPAGQSADGLPSLESVREALTPKAALIEYFTVKEQFIAVVLTRDSLQVVPITPVSRILSLVRLLRFQLSKFALGSDYIGTFRDTLLRVCCSHLHELYRELIVPLRHCISATPSARNCTPPNSDRSATRTPNEEPHAITHLVIVPHGVLHSIPFHALFDGERYLIDEFAISYAPSAGIYSLCHHKQSTASRQALIIGVPDERAPLIADEVRAISEILPGSRLVIGSEAGDEALRSSGQDCRWVHIATHGFFRQDNPMFSGIRLGSSYLSLYDLYQLKLNAELVTLSGCATGVNIVGAGDELLGLTRGLLYAGAESLLLTLWDVHDRSTSEFMSAMYQNLAKTPDRAVAFQFAVEEVRRRYPHPYFWAPFVLIGKVFPPQPASDWPRATRGA
jgi:tetratricopeptide (TPR) repeat protein